MKPGDTIKGGLNTVPFICPFCGRSAFAARNPPSVVHGLPPCRRFIELDVTAYLQAVNRENRRLIDSVKRGTPR